MASPKDVQDVQWDIPDTTGNVEVEDCKDATRHFHRHLFVEFIRAVDGTTETCCFQWHHPRLRTDNGERPATEGMPR